MAKLEYSRKDLMVRWGIKLTRLKSLVADGTLDAPFNGSDVAVKTKKHPRWSERQVKAAERRIEEKSMPKPEKFDANRLKVRGFNENQKRQIREYAERQRAKGYPVW